MNSKIARSDNQQFLEQFGYTIVASQLLNEYSAPSYSAATSILRNNTPETESQNVSPTASFGVHGAIFTAGASFAIVWLLNWTRSAQNTGSGFRRGIAFILFLLAVAAVFYAFAKRQWLKYLRHQAVQSASELVGNAQTFDSAASASIVFIQEVELVSRGYRMYVYTLFLMPCAWLINSQLEALHFHPSVASKNIHNRDVA